MRFFIGLLLGFSVGTVFAFPILIWMAALIASLFRFIGLPNESTYPQILIAFVIGYSAFAACSIRLGKKLLTSIRFCSAFCWRFLSSPSASSPP